MDNHQESYRDEILFSELIAKYRGRLYQHVLRLVKNKAHAEDVTQEATLRAFKAWGRFRWDCRFYTWLYRIGINAALNHLSSRTFRDDMTLSGEGRPHPGEAHFSNAVEYETPEHLLAQKALVEALDSALANMPLPIRDALIAGELDGLCYQAIAARLDCPVGTVRSRLHRGRQTLLNVIAEHVG